jgi:hypothetical protein
LHNLIKEKQAVSKITGEPQCIALMGLPGTGKSTILQTYTKAIGGNRDDTDKPLKVLYFETPSPATIKGVSSKILFALGDPLYEKGATWALNLRICRFLKARQVELVIMDDFHHLFESETPRALQQTSDWLKVLIKDSQVPFLVAGLEDKVMMILKENPQLSRLMASRETLHPLTLDPQHPDTLKEFSHFVQYVEREALGMPLSEELTRTEMLYRLHYATDGVVGNLMNLLREAMYVALKRKESQITLAILALCYDQRLKWHLRNRPNPFLLPPSEPLPPKP